MFARATYALVAALTLVPPGIAAAGTTEHDGVVSADPVDTTPHVLDGIVNAIALVDGTVVVGGSFGEVREAGSARTLRRANLFAYELATGRILPGFAPRLDRPVQALAAGVRGTVYAGGRFTRTGGARTRGLALLRLSDGSPLPRFGAQVRGGTVTSLARHGRHLYAGGDFTHVGDVARTALARLDAVTGEVDPSFTIEPGAPRGGRTRVHAISLGHGRLAVGGDFTTLGGLPRAQLGLVGVAPPASTARGLAPSPAAVAPWRTDAYRGRCMADFPGYVRGLDLAPDGSYLAVVTTGGPGGRGRMCDTAARFETAPPSETRAVRPTWVNHTGGDSLYAVAATGAAVYVGGHQRWLNNPDGHDSAGPGAVARPGIGAIHPRTGRALAWNPTRDRGIGIKAFLAHPGGLLVGSDTTRLGHEYHARVGMFPLPITPDS
ncbi:delta-60 repeat domain-containing protein [Streptosporangium sp. NPDC002721]|uniref:delta-60 repeat domain-containing protein n=1 Tax=Streptosporangium sp. NPDC002721 TaxID=3366188 RepID=UPI0036B63658